MARSSDGGHRSPPCRWQELLSPSSPGQHAALKMYLVPYIEADRPRNATQLSVQPLQTWPAASRFIRALIVTDLTAIHRLEPRGLYRSREQGSEAKDSSSSRSGREAVMVREGKIGGLSERRWLGLVQRARMLVSHSGGAAPAWSGTTNSHQGGALHPDRNKMWKVPYKNEFPDVNMEIGLTRAHVSRASWDRGGEEAEKRLPSFPLLPTVSKRSNETLDISEGATIRLNKHLSLCSLKKWFFRVLPWHGDDASVLQHCLFDSAHEAIWSL